MGAGARSACKHVSQPTFENVVSAIEFETENAIQNEANPLQEANCVLEIVDPIAVITADERKRILAQRELWPEVVNQTNAHNLQPYNIVKKAGTYNVLAARYPVQSQLKIGGWCRNTTGHIDDDWVIEMIK